MGPESDLGTNFLGIVGPNDVKKWPAQISDGFKYWDGSSWQPSNATDVIVKDCKYLGNVFSKLQVEFLMDFKVCI